MTETSVPKIVRICDTEFYSGSREQVDERITRMCAWLEQNSCGFYRVTRGEYLVTVAFYDREEAVKFSRRCETNLSFAIPFDNPLRVSSRRRGTKRDAARVDEIEQWVEDSCRGRYLITSRYDAYSREWITNGFFESECDTVAFSLRWA